MTPADGSPSPACSLPRLRSARSTGPRRRTAPGRTRGQPAPPPGSAKTGRRRSTARYDGALTPASPSTGKDSSSLTVPVNRPAPADPDTSPPASRPIEAQLRAGNGAGRPARPRPSRRDRRPAVARTPPGGLAMLQPKSSLSRPATRRWASRPPAQPHHAPDPVTRAGRSDDDSVTPDAALTARAYGNTYPTPQPRISAQIRSLRPKTADQRAERAPDCRVCHKQGPPANAHRSA